MTACLVYRSLNSFSSFNPHPLHPPGGTGGRGAAAGGGGRGEEEEEEQASLYSYQEQQQAYRGAGGVQEDRLRHPRGSLRRSTMIVRTSASAPLQAAGADDGDDQKAVDLRRPVMIDEAGGMTQVASPSFTLSPSDDHCPVSASVAGRAMEDADWTQEERRADAAQRPTGRPAPHAVSGRENGLGAQQASTMRHGEMEIDDVGGRSSEDSASRRLSVGSPLSVASDNDDEYIDISCGKSDSSCGESPAGKSSSSSTTVGGEAGVGATTEKKVYRCLHCKYITDRKNNLKRHVVTMHELCAKTLECCDIVFKNKASLRDHVVSCHKNGYDCRICGRTFCRKALLKRHVTVHSGQKDYICGVCGYATSHKSNLDRHKRRHGPRFSSTDDSAPDCSPCKSPPSPRSSSSSVAPSVSPQQHQQQQQQPPVAQPPTHPSLHNHNNHYYTAGGSHSPPSLPHQLGGPPFLAHKPSNPLDVSNLVSSSSSGGVSSAGSGRASVARHHAGGRCYTNGGGTGVIHRPEPIKPTAVYADGSPGGAIDFSRPLLAAAAGSGGGAGTPADPRYLPPGYPTAYTPLSPLVSSSPPHHPPAGLPPPPPPPPPPPVALLPPPPPSGQRRSGRGRNILAKRLLYTYRRSGSSDQSDDDKANPKINDDDGARLPGAKTMLNEDNANMDASQTHRLRQARQMGKEEEEELRMIVDDETTTTTRTTQVALDNNNYLFGGCRADRKLMLGLERQLATRRLLSTSVTAASTIETSQKVRLATRRLFPALYACRRCAVVYENQLQLTEHVERVHRDDDCPQLPRRPLTLQARPRAW